MTTETLGTSPNPLTSDITHTALLTQHLVSDLPQPTLLAQLVVYQVGLVTTTVIPTDQITHRALRATSTTCGATGLVALDQPHRTLLTTKLQMSLDSAGKTSMALAQLVPTLTTHTTTGDTTTPPITAVPTDHSHLLKAMVADTHPPTTSVLTTLTHTT